MDAGGCSATNRRTVCSRPMRSFGADVVLAMGCQVRFQAGSRQIHPEGNQDHPGPYGQAADRLQPSGGHRDCRRSGPVTRQLLDSIKAKREPQGGRSVDRPCEEDHHRRPAGVYKDTKTPIHPGRCAGEVAKFLEEEGRDWSLVIDGGEASVWMGGAGDGLSPRPAPRNRAERHHRNRTWPGRRGLGGRPQAGTVVHGRRQLRLLFDGDGDHGQAGYPRGLRDLERLQLGHDQPGGEAHPTRRRSRRGVPATRTCTTCEPTRRWRPCGTATASR